MNKMLEDDVATNKAIGNYGAQDILKRINDGSKAVLLTHCNTVRTNLEIYSQIKKRNLIFIIIGFISNSWLRNRLRLNKK